jgi:hypothetical protein
VQEGFIIRLKNNSCGEDFESLVAFLKKSMSQITMVSSQQRWILAAMDQLSAETVKKLPMVEMVRAVTLGKREVKLIRVKKQ